VASTTAKAGGELRSVDSENRRRGVSPERTVVVVVSTVGSVRDGIGAPQTRGAFGTTGVPDRGIGLEGSPGTLGDPVVSVAADAVRYRRAKGRPKRSEMDGGESEQLTVPKKRGKRPVRPRGGKELPDHRTVLKERPWRNQAPTRSQRKSNG
jgi:hypothetical protein